MKTIITTVVLSMFFVIACTNDSDSEKFGFDELNVNKELNTKVNTEASTETTLTSEEIEDLLFLREEEKMARDVYIFSYEKYDAQFFENIIESEKKHMSSVLKLLNKYGLEDSATGVIGEFNNSELQSLYNKFIEQSDISLLEAILVGDEIEELDIYDLEEKKFRTTKLDLLQVYGGLECGSRNHLRSFYSHTIKNEGVYEPLYLSQDEFNAVVNSERENCEKN